MNETITLPALTQQPLKHIDGTPDSRYPLRILEAYRRECDTCWEVHGLDEGASLVYEEMNRHQEQRAVLLDRAIAILRASPDPDYAQEQTGQSCEPQPDVLDS